MGYSLSGMLSRRICIASFNFTGSEWLKRVFLTFGQSKDATEGLLRNGNILSRHAGPPYQKPSPATRTLRLHTQTESRHKRAMR